MRGFVMKDNSSAFKQLQAARGVCGMSLVDYAWKHRGEQQEGMEGEKV
jgi:hypothetical protein